MAKHANGIGRFTARNIAAVLRTPPETDSTCQEVVRQAREYAVNLPQSSNAKWGAAGRTHIRTGKRQTAYARFAQNYHRIKSKHCDPDVVCTVRFLSALHGRQLRYAATPHHSVSPTCRLLAYPD